MSSLAQQLFESDVLRFPIILKRAYQNRCFLNSGRILHVLYFDMTIVCGSYCDKVISSIRTPVACDLPSYLKKMLNLNWKFVKTRRPLALSPKFTDAEFYPQTLGLQGSSGQVNFKLNPCEHRTPMVLNTKEELKNLRQASESSPCDGG